MKKKYAMLLLAGLTLLSSANFARAEETDRSRLGIDLTVFWASKFIWHGVDYFDNHSGLLNTVNFDLFDSGFNAGLVTAHTGSSGSVNKEGFAYYLKYCDSVFDDSRFKTDYRLRWQYYDFYRNPSDAADLQELRLNMSWPEVFSENLIPQYQISYLYSAKSDGLAAAREPEGFLHIFSLCYIMNPPQLSAPLYFDWNITYRDGWGGEQYAHNWSHITLKLSTPIDFGKGTLRPSLNYQISMEDTVNENNELYATMTYKISF
jgi:hypothetical protein